MAEIDPVIFEFHARVNGYLADVSRTTKAVDSGVARQERRIKDLERQMARSSAEISGHLRGLAGTLATYFTGRELVGLLDNFTRLQNSLKVAGLEGNELKRVQDALFASAQKNGVAVNTLADLYGKAAAAQKELGATQGQLLQLTDLTAKSLLITGTSTEQASGAILGLAQALGNAKLQAEEFNQINEGGLRPLLQAAAGERFGGSVSKLRQAVVDGKVSNKEFFDLVLKGAKDIQDKAGKATLTLAAGFNTLTNALTIYFGEADKANGVSAALGTALGKLADNLDILIPAVAIVATALGARYVVGATAAAGATVMASNAMFALRARAIGAATSVEALAFAMQGMRANLITAALLAIGGAIYYVATQSTAAEAAAEQFAAGQAKAAKATEKAAEAADSLATAHGKARTEALALARAEAENVKQKLASARASLVLAESEAARQIKARPSETESPGSLRGLVARGTRSLSDALFPGSATPPAGQRANELKGEIDGYNKTLRSIEAKINAAETPAVSVAGSGKGKKGGKGSTGPSAAEITDRYTDELVGYAQRIASARASMATNAEDRAEFELQQVERERRSALADIEANKEYDKGRKKMLRAAVEALTIEERAQVDFNKRRQLEQEAQDIADERYNAERRNLDVQMDLADSQGERKRLALQILAAEQEHLRSVLDAVIVSKTANDADRQRAQIALDALNAVAAGEQASAARQNETPRERYLRDLNKSPEAINEAVDQIKIDGLDALNDGLVDAITGVKSLGDVFKNVANQIIADLLRIAIQKTIVNSLGNALFGGAKLFGGAPALGAGAPGSLEANFDAAFNIPRRAAGGPVSPGGTYLVGERGPELLSMGGRGGFITPNNKLGSPQSSGPTSINVTVNAQNAVLTSEVRGWVAQGVQQAIAVSTTVSPSLAEGRMMSRGRRRIPG